MKKFLSIILTFALILTVMPLGLFTIPTVAATSGYYTYTVTGGKATITDCDTSVSGNIIIPSTLGGYPVTSIGEYAFTTCDSLISITIPNGVTNIGEGAFSPCESLTNITISNSVINIGAGAFAGCFSLTGITIPNSVMSIGGDAFYDCHSLKNITLSNNITRIESGLFYRCYSLTSITIPDSVTSMGAWAFYNCTSLVSVTIPLGVTVMGREAFFNCNNLKRVYYEGTSTQKQKISIDTTNQSLTNAQWYYEICTGTTKHSYDNICDTVCNVCDYERDYSHDFKWIIDKQATCADSGIRHQECSVCYTKQNENSVIDATNKHTYDDVCDGDCNVCGKIREKPHSFKWIVDKNATCGHTGVKHEECSVCHIKRNENTVIDATGKHTYDDVCDAECNVCGYIRTDIHIFNNICDTVCNNCDFLRDVPEHQYGNDLTCDICKYSKAPPMPNVISILADSVTIETVVGREYSLDKTNWQESNIFSELTPNTTYTIYQRVAETDTAYASEPSEGITVTTANGFLVIYDANGGTNAPDSHIKTEGITLTLSSQEPERSGYKFDGWAIETDGDSVYNIGDEYITDSDIILYAQWLKLCTDCDGDGEIKVSCTRCGGDGKITTASNITCYDCNGKGIWCRYCGTKAGFFSGACSVCYSTSFIYCDDCGGAGNTLTTTTCPKCVSGKIDKECTTCTGTGVLKEVKQISIAEFPEKISFSETTNSLLVSGGKITLYYTDETSETIDLLATMISGYDSTVVGSQNLTITYDEKTTTLQTTVKLIQTLIPSSPIVSSFTDTTVTLISVMGCEYSKDGINWQSSNVFTGLSSGTKYTFYQRYVETDTHEASDNSVGTNVTTDKSKQTLVPNAPTVQSFTANSITLNSVSECEYSKDGISWQSSPVFSGLSCGTEYTFYQRYKETSSTYVGKSSAPLTIKTDKGTQSAPSAPILTRKTHNSVTLKAVSGYEYSRDGINWQTSNVFTGLKPETNYMFYQRKAETDKYYVGSSSTPLTVKTLEEPQYTLGDLDENEVVTDRDAVHLLYYTFLPDLYPINQDCDFNGDGEVTDRDAIYLLYHTFLPDMYPIG